LIVDCIIVTVAISVGYPALQMTKPTASRFLLLNMIINTKKAFKKLYSTCFSLRRFGLFLSQCLILPPGWQQQKTW